MRIVTAEEVLQRDSAITSKVTSLVNEWLPKITTILGLEPDTKNEIELLLMPSQFILDEFERPMQFSVFYNENGNVSQLQFSSLWTVAGVSMSEGGEEIVSPFEPDHPLFERSVVEALTAMLLEAKNPLYDLDFEARDASRSEFYKEANAIITDLIGDAPDGWVNGLVESFSADKMLN